ncbi:hypothetical protein cyc_05853 [Cyclospora cayetanensis]|uniref:Uncharacterized protein n=1 Tax=Cyclospora cayetanensis TaxID=88456 RepID=A0A1D3CWT2_9EIME|nr:hypothetical protein cyc_05853 [Cyclospora cayetanensis]
MARDVGAKGCQGNHAEGMMGLDKFSQIQALDVLMEPPRQLLSIWNANGSHNLGNGSPTSECVTLLGTCSILRGLYGPFWAALCKSTVHPSL